MPLGRKFLPTAAALVLSASAVSGLSQAARTYVSAAGTTNNTCSFTTPCSTFTQALSVTASGGEVDALDQGDFGAFTVAQPVTIDGGGRLAGVTSSTTAVSVNTGGVVTLRNFNVRSSGGSSGTNGITLAGGTLHLENVVVSGFGDGIYVNGGSGTVLTLDRVTSRDNGNAGLYVAAASTVIVHDSNFLNTTGGAGVFLGASSFSTLRNVVSSGNGTAGVALDGSGGTAQLALVNSTLSSNTGPGLRVGGTGGSGSSIARLTGNSLFLNGNAVTINGGGLVGSYGDNEYGGQVSGGSVTTLSKQ